MECLPQGELSCPKCGDPCPAFMMHGMMVVECPKHGINQPLEDFDVHIRSGPLGDHPSKAGIENRSRERFLRRFEDGMAGM